MECEVMGIRLHYDEFGNGRPFFGLHGWPLDNRHMIAEFEPLFAGRSGWRRIYPDFPGMGQTPAADWITCQDQMLDVLQAFVEQIAPGERFTVAGMSYGGYMARGLVYRCGARMDGMMINVPMVEPDSSRRQLPAHRVIKEDATFQAALKPNEQHVVEMLSAQSLETLERLRAVYDPAVAVANFAFLERVGKQYAFSFAVDQLPEPFEAPALILTGRFDHWCGYREAYTLLDQYPRATYAVLDRASHALALEESGLFMALGREWLDRVEEFLGQRAM